MANSNVARRKSESSNVIIAQKAIGQGNVDFGNYAGRSKTLQNQKIGNVRGLLDYRKGVQDRVDTLNKTYIDATQDVLNDKTLDFLIEHSNINAPTLTSIFAGYELARASRADKEGEELKFQTESLRADEARQAELVNLANQSVDVDLGVNKETFAVQQANTAATADAERGDLAARQASEAARLKAIADKEKEDNRNKSREKVAEIKATADKEKAAADKASTGVSSLFEGVNPTSLPGSTTPPPAATVVPDTTPEQSLIGDGVTTDDPVIEEEAAEQVAVPEEPVADQNPTTDQLLAARDAAFGVFEQDTTNDGALESFIAINDQLGVEGGSLRDDPLRFAASELNSANRELSRLAQDDLARPVLLEAQTNARNEIDKIQRDSRLRQAESALSVARTSALNAPEGSEQRNRFELAAREQQAIIDELST